MPQTKPKTNFLTVFMAWKLVRLEGLVKRLSHMCKVKCSEICIFHKILKVTPPPDEHRCTATGGTLEYIVDVGSSLSVSDIDCRHPSHKKEEENNGSQ